MSWYELKLEMDDNESWMVISDDFPELATFGATIEEAVTYGREAIEEALAYRISEGLELPAPYPTSDGMMYRAQISMLTLFKCAIYVVAKTKNVTRAELSRQLDWKREQVDRIFRLDHNSQFDQIEKVLTALGVEIGNPINQFNAAA